MCVKVTCHPGKLRPFIAQNDLIEAHTHSLQYCVKALTVCVCVYTWFLLSLSLKEAKRNVSSGFQAFPLLDLSILNV